jgi:hypothetical protein
MHAVKRNDPEVQRTKTKLDAIRRPASVTQRPVAQPAKEKVMERAPKVFQPRQCLCCGETFLPTGSTQRFAPGHKPKKTAATPVKAAPANKASASRTAAEFGIKAPKAEPLCGLVDLAKLKCDLLAKLAAVELIEKTYALEIQSAAALGQ